MKKCLGAIRKANEEFGLIHANDTVAIGVSGGKDSTCLLYAMKEYQYYSKEPFSFFGICLDLGNDGFDISPIQDLCKQKEIDFHVVKTDIFKIVFDIRQEKNPCSLCAKLRKGALIKECKNLGANKLALGHHRDDLLETFILSLMYEGKLNALSPKTYLDRMDITQIRPFIHLEESHIKKVVRKYEFPICKSLCPMDGKSKRNEAKDVIAYMENNNKQVKKIMTTAITNYKTYKLWKPEDNHEI